MVSTGLREVIGSWKIMPILLPRMPDLVLVHLEDVFAFEENLAADDLAGRVRNKPEHREGADTLAATTLTHQSENLARHDVIADAVDRLNRPLFSEKVRRLLIFSSGSAKKTSLWQQPACVLDEAVGVIIMSHARWGSGDSNPDALRHVILSHARLPFRHFPEISFPLVGRLDSNPEPAD